MGIIKGIATVVVAAIIVGLFAMAPSGIAYLVGVRDGAVIGPLIVLGNFTGAIGLLIVTKIF